MASPVDLGRSLRSPLRGLRALRDELPRVVLVLAAGDLVSSFGFSLFLPFLTIYLVEGLGASAAEAGLVVAAYSLCSIASGIAGGWLADRVGRRPVLIVSISSTAVIVAAMALATEVWHVGLLMLLLGSLDPAFLPAARAAVADTVEEARRPRAFGLLGVANALGWIAGPVIGAGLSAAGYPLLFAAGGLLVGVYAVIAVRWLPETRPTVPHPAALPVEPTILGPVAVPGSVTLGAPDLPPDETDDVDAGTGAARARVYLLFLPLFSVAQALTFLWVTTLPIHAAGDLGVPTTAWGLLFGINGLLIVLFQLRVATASESRSKPRILALSMGLYAAGLALVAGLGPTTAIAGLAGTITLVTLGEMLFMPIVPAFVAELSPVRRRGTYQGVALAAGGLGSALGPPIAGHLLDSGWGAALWLGAAGLLGLTGLALLGIGRLADGLPRAG